ncbi:glycosyltransferase family 2 protein [Aeromonas caviae]|uniref:glycosyltransferase family 2 protein n=1 Tax=Aeromonas caviae TaxID=648 RepID=UPI0038D0C91D
MLVSVVIPTFNSSSYIHRTIASLINQTHKELEIIVVDDNSPDYEELKACIDAIETNINIRLYKSHTKNNASYSRNYGVDKARGDYIAFLDSDDIFYPEKIEIQLKMMVADDLDWSYTALNHVKLSDIGKKDNIKPLRGKFIDEDFYDYLFLHNGLIQTSTIMIKKQLAAYFKFNELLVRHQDYDYCELLFKSSLKYGFINEPLTYWILPEVYVSPLNKKQSYDFCKEWILSKKMSESAKDWYIVNNILLVSIKSKKPKEIIKFFLSSAFSFKTKFNTIIKLAIHISKKL